MNTNKTMTSFLLSLTLLSTVGPALGMENSSKNEIEKEGKQEVEINNKPTFGKLIDGNLLNKSQVWAAVIAFKKQLPAMIVTAGENSSELPMEIVENILFHYLLDTTIDPKIRANVALEFLADPEYKFLHSALVNSDVKYAAYPLVTQLNYSKEVQDMLRRGISKALLDSEISYFCSNSNCRKSNHIVSNLVKSDECNLYLYCDEDLLTLAKHMFSTQPTVTTFPKTDFTLIFCQRLVTECTKRKINLNFENESGLTPLIWTTTLPEMWLTSTLAVELHLSLFKNAFEISPLEGKNLLKYKNKYGKSFEDLAKPRLVKFLNEYIEKYDKPNDNEELFYPL